MEVDAAIQDERAVNLISAQVETVEEGAGRLRWRLVGLFFCGRRRRRDVVDAKVVVPRTSTLERVSRTA